MRSRAQFLIFFILWSHGGPKVDLQKMRPKNLTEIIISDLTNKSGIFGKVWVLSDGKSTRPPS